MCLTIPAKCFNCTMWFPKGAQRLKVSLCGRLKNIICLATKIYKLYKHGLDDARGRVKCLHPS